MTDRSAGPRCGNSPNTRLTPGDRKAVDDFKARLALQAAIKPYIERAVWVDFDPLMEVIAATVWEHCARDDEDMPQLVRDDPRTIAAFAAAVARAHAAVPAPATDQAALRQQVIEALYEARRPGLGGMTEAEAVAHMADAVLSVLPAPFEAALPSQTGPKADSKAVAVLTAAERAMLTYALDQAQEKIWSEDGFTDEDQAAVTSLRRMADETQQPEAEAHPPEHSWAPELYDPLAEEWVPGTRYITRDRAVNHLTHANSVGSTWKDGTPVQRRLVRATTTYTVEAEPAAVQQPKEARP